MGVGLDWASPPRVFYSVHAPQHCAFPSELYAALRSVDLGARPACAQCDAVRSGAYEKGRKGVPAVRLHSGGIASR